MKKNVPCLRVVERDDAVGAASERADMADREGFRRRIHGNPAKIRGADPGGACPGGGGGATADT